MAKKAESRFERASWIVFQHAMTVCGTLTVVGVTWAWQGGAEQPLKTFKPPTNSVEEHSATNHADQAGGSKKPQERLGQLGQELIEEGDVPAGIPASVIDAQRELLGGGRFVGHGGTRFGYVPAGKVRTIQQGDGVWIVSALAMEWVDNLETAEKRAEEMRVSLPSSQIDVTLPD